MELEAQDLTESEGWTLVWFDDDEERLSIFHYDSQEEMLADCERDNIDTDRCLAFEGKQDALRLGRKLALIMEEDEEDDDDEDVTTEDVEEKLRGRFTPVENKTIEF